MKARLNFYAQFPQAMEKFTEVEALIRSSSLDHKLLHLVKLRASQINKCAFCVDMHAKEARKDEERELRLHHVAVWEESPLFTDKEKAALRWTEALTTISTNDVSDSLYLATREHFSEKEIVELSVAIAMINSWNRLSVSFRNQPGSADKAFGLDKVQI